MDKWLAHPWPQAAPANISLAPLERLMNARLALMTDVARDKWNTRGAIEDVPREQIIIDGLKMQAQALGVPAAWAEHFFRAQIETAKLIQRDLFAHWEKTGAGRFADAPDLAKVIRPRLDALTPQLLNALAAAWPALADPTQGARIAAAMQKLPAMAASPLIDGSASKLAP
ncbi:gamma subclass chorismate mutase AroQ [Herbaspirillum sp. RTI4]|uniref:gamma subclass chorismate mutase AroQ n=1 Tax=Herbaspirillum sp. RTI4 TaxID=3048640 RepID=UPI003A0FF995